MTLAVCLLTADRPELTQKTVKSFRNHNRTKGVILLHADDGSKGNHNFQIAERAGFETVICVGGAGKRVGQVIPLSIMWAEAASRGATHILHLENDQEFVAPLPTRRDAQCIRLYGEKKEQGDGPRAYCGKHIIGTKELIHWDVDGHDWQRGEAHWGGQASITETELLLKGIENAKRMKDISMRLQRLDTLRPYKNIVWHIGTERTPGGVF